MKNFRYGIGFIFFSLLFLLSCQKYNDDLYSFYRVYFPSTYRTLKGTLLRTQAVPDRLHYSNDSVPGLTAYSAEIEGEFISVYDTIVQHGHVWSMDNPNPVINPNAPLHYSRLGAWPTDSSGVFVTKIENLYPNTPFYVRSYIVTIHGDTGYNPSIYVDTTLKAVDAWFKAPALSGSQRTGAVALSYYDPTKGYQVGILATGNTANEVLNDVWIYDPEEKSWQNIANYPVGITQAVGFILTYTNAQGQEITKLYLGTGETNPYGSGQTNIWYEYDFTDNRWSQTIANADYPINISRAVAFTIGKYGYVAFGQLSNGAATNAIYRFDPTQADRPDGTPWISMPVVNSQYARYDAIAFVVDSAAFIALGQNSGTYFNDIWTFVPNNTTGGSWTRKTTFPGQARSQAVVFVINKHAFIGLGKNDITGFKDFYRYEPFTNSWNTCADYKIGPDFSGGFQKTRDAVAFALNQLGFVGTGYKTDDSLTPYTSEFWFYQPW